VRLRSHFVLPFNPETREIPFVLAWDFVTELHLGCSITVATPIFLVALASMPGDHAHRLAAIKLAKANSILATTNFRPEDLPNWFKMALFNELYDLTGGGTL